MDNSPDETKPKFKVTLLPNERPGAQPHAAPQIILNDDGEDITSEQLPHAIPESPLHVCPSCRYNLTGLKTRRCPECGELFDLLEARRIGARRLPHVRQDLLAVFLDNATLYISGSAYLLALFLGWFMLRGARGAWGAWIAGIGVLIALAALMYKVYCQRTLSQAAVFAAIAAGGIVSMLVTILS